MMRFTPPRCPECNDAPKGTLETVEGVAHIIVNDDESAEYDGWTEILWNTQKTIRDAAGRGTLIGTCGHVWQSEIVDVEEDSQARTEQAHVASSLKAVPEQLPDERVTWRHILYDFDAETLVTTHLYNDYEEACDDANVLGNVLVLKVALPAPTTVDDFDEGDDG